VPRLERCRSVSDELRIGVDMLAEQPESTVIAVKLVAESPCGSSLSSTLQSLNSLESCFSWKTGHRPDDLARFSGSKNAT
jgi:hypothetical protein